jgi:hypothetical protein
MRTVFAGWAAGYAMSIVTTISLTIILARIRDTSRIESIIAREVPAALLAVPVFIGTTLVWTLAGLILGALFRVGGFEDQQATLGAPGGPWLMIVIALGALPLPPLLLLLTRYWRLWLANALAFVALFGWVMPLLATR